MEQTKQSSSFQLFSMTRPQFQERAEELERVATELLAAPDPSGLGKRLARIARRVAARDQLRARGLTPRMPGQDATILESGRFAVQPADFGVDSIVDVESPTVAPCEDEATTRMHSRLVDWLDKMTEGPLGPLSLSGSGPEWYVRSIESCIYTMEEMAQYTTARGSEMARVFPALCEKLGASPQAVADMSLHSTATTWVVGLCHEPGPSCYLVATAHWPMIATDEGADTSGAWTRSDVIDWAALAFCCETLSLQERIKMFQTNLHIAYTRSLRCGAGPSTPAERCAARVVDSASYGVLNHAHSDLPEDRRGTTKRGIRISLWMKDLVGLLSDLGAGHPNLVVGEYRFGRATAVDVLECTRGEFLLGRARSGAGDHHLLDCFLYSFALQFGSPRYLPPWCPTPLPDGWAPRPSYRIITPDFCVGLDYTDGVSGADMFADGGCAKPPTAPRRRPEQWHDDVRTYLYAIQPLAPGHDAWARGDRRRWRELGTALYLEGVAGGWDGEELARWCDLHVREKVSKS